MQFFIAFLFLCHSFIVMLRDLNKLFPSSTRVVIIESYHQPSQQIPFWRMSVKNRYKLHTSYHSGAARSQQVISLSITSKCTNSTSMDAMYDDPRRHTRYQELRCILYITPAPTHFSQRLKTAWYKYSHTRLPKPLSYLRTSTYPVQ